MPRRSLTSGRKFSTTMSAFFTSFRKSSIPSGSFRFRVRLRRLRCRFCQSAVLRPAPNAPSASSAAGRSILMTSAPQSASWRTAVGPERTRERSSTRIWESADEAGWCGMSVSSQARNSVRSIRSAVSAALPNAWKRSASASGQPPKAVFARNFASSSVSLSGA